MGEKFQWLLGFLQFLIPADFYMIYQILIVILSFGFIGVVFFSIYKNRQKVSFYQMITREDGRISKVGISFIFVQMLIIYQVVTGTHVDSYLVELLAVIFGAELGTKYVGKIGGPKKDYTERRGRPKITDDDWDDI